MKAASYIYSSSVIFLLICCSFISITGITATTNPNQRNEPLQIVKIAIINNNDLLNKAEEFGWSGTGEIDDPIRIENLHFSNSDHMFTIAHTDLYFIFCNNTLDGISKNMCAIVVWEISNGIFMHNEIYSADVGIHFVGVNDTIVSNNRIYDNEYDGVFMEEKCFRNTIADNLLYGNDEAGVVIITGSNNNSIMHNDVFDSNYGVIIGSDSTGNSVTNNYLHRCDVDGIYLNSDSNLVTDNHVNSTGHNGIRIGGYNNSIRNNMISSNDGYGIMTVFESGNTTVADNILDHNTHRGLFLWSNTTIVQHNDFIDNGEISQACDNGTNNFVSSNYWSDWISPDVDSDYVVDSPYLLNGSAGNMDLTPSSLPLNTPELWSPVLLLEDNPNDQNADSILIAVTFSIVLITFISLIIWRKKQHP